jgi:hypothetical protein
MTWAEVENEAVGVQSEPLFDKGETCGADVRARPPQ